MEPRQPEREESSTATVDEVLKPMEAPSDGEGCPICLDQEGATTAWKETVCGHIFHERCVERWLQAKGSCPMCRLQLQQPRAPAKPDVRYRSPLIFMAMEWEDNSPLSNRTNYFRQYREETFVG
ncbi:hypothetical protein CFC21_036380 [Triticum aestivum]|uniref:RING-type domain-containing protein n=3 Tax=Triticum TaxID=4564 RepID=A0A9R0VIQ1_TRITD|nr:hypothetical protein CFC21_036380 [Triticum aestivum]VAH58585.1 unnamed protein product [Triticum turgidum subsp. durum]